MSTFANQQAEDAWSKAEEEISANERREELREQLHEEQHPSRRMIHHFFVLISAITGLSAFFMGVGQLIGILFQFTGPIQYVLRMYVLVLCLLAVMVELEWTKFVRDSVIFNVWITRGIFLCFIGLLGLEQNDTSTTKNSDSPHFVASEMYLKCVAWIMIACGTLYFFMGVFCLQLLYNRVRKDHQERLTRATNFRRTNGVLQEAP